MFALSRRQFNFGLVVSALFKADRGAAPIAPIATAETHVMDFAIAGGHYHGLAQALPDLIPGARLVLKREADNRFDPNAVAVCSTDGLRLGYVPRRVAGDLALLLDSGRQLRVEVTRLISEKRPEGDEPKLMFTHFSIGDPVIRTHVIDADDEARSLSA